MTTNWTRRRFLAAVATALPGASVLPAPFLAAEGALSRGVLRPSGFSRSEEGPPRQVVGLQTHGGHFRFDPVGLLIEPGTELIWFNMGDFHTTTAFHSANNQLFPGEIPTRIPPGAKSWHSGFLGLDAGTEFPHTFTVQGVYDYFCQPHYGFGMVGRIIVGGPRGGPAVTRPLDELVEAARTTMPEVAAILGAKGRAYEWASRLNGVLYAMSHGGDPAPGAQWVREGMADDELLQDHIRVQGNPSAFLAAMERFTQGAADGAGYEEMVVRADAMKQEMASI